MRELYRFCLLGLTFLLVFSVLYLLKNMKDVKDGYYKSTLPGYEIYNAIEKSKKRISKKKLVIGDSTGYQYYMHISDEDSIYSLACNQAIGMCGHFFLLDDFLKTGNRPEQVYMVFYVSSFSNNLDQKFTYHYFLKPFCNKNYEERMSETVKRQIEKVPYHSLSQFPRILTSSWAPVYNPPSEFHLMSPISNEYLLKIDSLQKAYGFELYLIPCLARKGIKEWNERLFQQHMNEVDPRLREVVDRYFQGIHYMEDTCFSDGKHLKNPQLYRNMIEGEMRNDSNKFRIH